MLRKHCLTQNTLHIDTHSTGALSLHAVDDTGSLSTTLADGFRDMYLAVQVGWMNMHPLSSDCNSTLYKHIVLP